MTAQPVDPWAFDYPVRISLAVSLLGDHHCTGSCARVISQAMEILRSDTPPVLRTGVGRSRDNKGAPGAVGADIPGLAPTVTAEGADVDIIARTADKTRQARDIARLQQLLTEAIATREDLVQRNITLYERSKHWFVPGSADQVHCAACNLPRGNARHVERAA